MYPYQVNMMLHFLNDVDVVNDVESTQKSQILRIPGLRLLISSLCLRERMLNHSASLAIQKAFQKTLGLVNLISRLSPSILYLYSLKTKTDNETARDIAVLYVHASSKGSNNSQNINRGSYMSANVLLNLLNELRKRDKMGGLASILSLFRNEFNKINNTGVRMLDSIYHMTLKLF